MGALLALASAVVYGVVDFFGGLLSRRAHYATVTVVGQVGGLVLAVAVAAWAGADHVGGADLLWGALSGVGSGTAMLFLNRGMSRGAVSVVVPVSAVTGVALSVVAGVCFLGDRPGFAAWLGIVVTLAALWLVSRGDGSPAAREERPAVADGLVASLGVAVQYVGLAQADPASGLWAVAAGRLGAVLVLLPTAVRHASRLRETPGRLGAAALIGAGAAVGLMLYLDAAHREMLAVAVVLASFYPAIPVLLGIAVLRERLSPGRTVGLVAAAAAIALLTVA
ncbi:EamA family transporter [Streptomyces sp. RFCAC02]|uniref:EamA family transporter n=1 Tax=Streptomyces sp. RFCAC02 TaxID=2499143 RepID=UPI0010223AD7|nr:EamA family transporter [Streptomyces sp. RFCAC02]